MATYDFLAFLDERRKQARAHFLACKQALEDYERDWGPDFTFTDPWQSQVAKLAHETRLAYKDYQKAWVEWFAKLNGYVVFPPDPDKSTEANATPVPTAELIDEIEVKVRELLRKEAGL